jgi:hypothetical protein
MLLHCLAESRAKFTLLLVFGIAKATIEHENANFSIFLCFSACRMPHGTLMNMSESCQWKVACRAMMAILQKLLPIGLPRLQTPNNEYASSPIP